MVRAARSKRAGLEKIYDRNGARVVRDVHVRGIVIEDGGFVSGKVDLSPQGIFPFRS